MDRITIAIDGHSSCGKSTFAKAIAQRMGYIFIDTGAMYRAVTLFALERGFIVDSLVDRDAIIASLDRVEITFVQNPESGKSEVAISGESVESKIRSMDVSSAVSAVSSIAQVRAKLVAEQQKMGCGGGVVMDGRDIGTVVFPNAELKIFMTASPQVRAKRRYDELQAKGESVTMEQIIDNVVSRDRADETRSESPLRRAEDALLLDNSAMSVEQQMAWFEDKIASL